MLSWVILPVILLLGIAIGIWVSGGTYYPPENEDKEN